jgi:hypothetical protein
MPTSELRRAAALAAAGLLLAACDPSMVPGAGAASRARVNVAGQAVTIVAPPGFCVDSGSTSQSADGAFVLMSDCQLLGGPSSGKAPVGAALTASVSTAGLGGEGDAADSLDDLRDFAATREGRAVLGRSGQPGRVRILDSQVKNGVLYVLVEDRGTLPIAGIDPRFWRAFLEVNGRMVALSGLGFEGAGFGLQDGLDQMAALAHSIRAANPGG